MAWLYCHHDRVDSGHALHLDLPGRSLRRHRGEPAGRLRAGHADRRRAPVPATHRRPAHQRAGRRRRRRLRRPGHAHRRQRRGGTGDLLRGLRRRLPRCRRDHEGRHERSRPQHRRHLVVLGGGGQLHRRGHAGRRRAADRADHRRQHPAAAAGECDQPHPDQRGRHRSDLRSAPERGCRSRAARARAPRRCAGGCAVSGRRCSFACQRSST